ncbi:sugar ABC transporter substrate-binding protein [Ornithinimicrobium pekingense]|uniref:Sugar ABC transporter substrate-binding protein n=1 Tax=Ornithinimicrobium pekingense TaxID=384677 RepID=A0ABQ2FBD2_9MICO|nr:maltose ABC transporter substrate-binding protein [Ornithinimicrobium pekingense]GGK76840.1 sugar ABC transporter substrate-binding protein [Ornithinimicrobium pekingense]
MKRTTGAVAIASAAALLLSACGGDSETPAGQTPADTQDAAEDTAGDDAAETTEDDAAAGGDAASETAMSDGTSLVIWADDLRAAALEDVAAIFEEETGVPVTLQVVANENLREQFKDSVGAGAGPDIAVGAHDWLGELVQNNVVAPVQLSSDLAGQFTPESVEAFTYEGQTYGVPYSVESLALIRNTEMAPEEPATMEELVATGQEMVEAGETELVMAQQLGQEGDAYNMYPYLAAYGGGIFPVLEEGGFDSTEVIIDSEETIQGGEKIAWLGEQEALTVNLDGSNTIPQFIEGNTPYLISGPWAIPQIVDAGIDYEITSMPDFEDGGETTPFLGVQGFYVSAESKNPQIAQTFVQEYVSRPDVQVALYEAGDRPPALVEAYDEVSQGNTDIEAWGAAAEGGTPMPNIPQMNAVWGPLGKATADIVTGSDPAERLATAQSEVEAAL